MSDWRESLARYDKNWKELIEIDRTCAQAGQIAGRFIQEPYADGHAVYQIVKENKKTVKIRVVTGLGDDWVLPYWGEETTIEKSYAQMKLNQRDMLAKLFKAKS